VHFAVSREFAEAEVIKFNEYFNTLSEVDRKLYYGNRPASIALYDRCDKCGEDYKNFKATPKQQAEAVRGSTIGPIIK
jgi:hypothetical protein